MLRPQQVQPELQQAVLVPHPAPGGGSPIVSWERREDILERQRAEFMTRAIKNRTKGMVKRVLTTDDQKDFPIRPMFVKFRIVDASEFQVEGWGSPYLVLDVNHLSEQAAGWINTGQIVMDQWDSNLVEQTREAVQSVDLFTRIRPDETPQVVYHEDEAGIASKMRDLAKDFQNRGYEARWSISQRIDSSMAPSGDVDIEVNLTLRRPSKGGPTGDKTDQYRRHLDNNRIFNSLSAR